MNTTRREVARRVLERLDDVEAYGGKKHKLRAIIQQQARLVAGFVRGEARYRPFIGKW